MSTIILPPALRFSILMAFWLALSLLAGIIISVIVSIWISPTQAPLGLIAVPILALPGLLWPQLAILPYGAWNRLAGTFARFARTWLMGICFYVIVVAVGRSG